MNNGSRLKKSFLNFISGIGYRILTLVTAFIVRTVFVKCLNAEYLGINGLYTNILTMLSLAELGFGTAMVYGMYKPLAENDEEKLKQLMALYKKVYSIIGTVVLIIGLCLVPFLDVLIKNPPDIKGLTFYYILFLLNSVVSYWFFAYRNSLLQADQKAYIVTNYNSIFNIIKSIVQIIVLLVFHNFTFYLITQILCTIGQNVFVAIKVDKIYPFIKVKSESKLPKQEKSTIFKDVRALMLTKIGHVALTGTDNIIISSFVGIKEVGILSNFLMISDAVTAVLCQIMTSISASLGNFFVKEDKESGYILFKRVEFLNFWLYGFSMIALITLLNPFVNIWLGESYLLEKSAVICLGINFFVAGFMNTISTFRTSLGLFVQGKYRPIIVAVINVGLSILLSYKWGVTGVLAATFISRLCVNLWYDPILVIKKGFGVSPKDFFVKYFFRIILLGTITVIMAFVKKYVCIFSSPIVNFILLAFCTALIPNIIFVLFTFKKDEFKYYLEIIKGMVKKITKKL